MTSQVSQQVRQSISNYMAELPVPSRIEDANAEARPDGVIEFGVNWIVRGDSSNGVYGSYSDRDDVIEFGLFARDVSSSTNILHVTIILDEDGDRLNCMSESNSDLNFDAPLRDVSEQRFIDVLSFFKEMLTASA